MNGKLESMLLNVFWQTTLKTAKKSESTHDDQILYGFQKMYGTV